MLTEKRATILSYEAQYGTNPNSTYPTQPQNQIATANSNVTLFNAKQNSQQNAYIQAPLYPVQTLAQAFNPEAELVATTLNSTFGSIIPTIGISTDPNYPLRSFNIRSTDVFIAPDAFDILNGLGNSLLDNVKPEDSPSANHIVIGPMSVITPGIVDATLSGGSGSDILIAGAGNELLYAGLGSDTLIGGQGIQALDTLAGGSSTVGDDTLYGGFGSDTFEFSLPATAVVSETIVPLGFHLNSAFGSVPVQRGAVEVSFGNSAATVLGGSSTTPLQLESSTGRCARSRPSTS
jgi:hypothetical protein